MCSDDDGGAVEQARLDTAARRAPFSNWHSTGILRSARLHRTSVVIAARAARAPEGKCRYITRLAPALALYAGICYYCKIAYCRHRHTDSRRDMSGTGRHCTRERSRFFVGGTIIMCPLGITTRGLACGRNDEASLSLRKMVISGLLARPTTRINQGRTFRISARIIILPPSSKLPIFLSW